MRLIDADVLAELLKREAEHHEADGLLERSYGVLDAYMDVLQAPTVHPEPPKRGKAWIYIDDDNWIYDSYKCPWCGKEITIDAETKSLSRRRSDISFTIEDIKYCPNCGAKMEN